jgi:hypothetical protein
MTIKRLASAWRPIHSARMKRFVISVCIAAALGIGACERQSAENLPEHYKHKGSHQAGADHPKPAGHDEKEKAPAGQHKG